MKLSKEKFIHKLSEKVKNIGIELNPTQLEKLYMYKELLIEWNEKINLTAITDDEEIIDKHIIDSLHIVKYIEENQKVIDVGTGAGLPGIIIAIYFESKIDMTLFDALNKRIIFLQEVIDKLELKNVYAIHGRAEETSKQREFRECYDVVVSRAVARLNILMEITIPFVKIGGICLYMKAEKTDEEIKEANKAICELSVNHLNTESYMLDIAGDIHTHTILSYQKLKTTKERYPRQYAKIKKNPL